jgi:hypothetical protein
MIYSKKTVRILTQVNVLKECHVQGSTNGVYLVGIEDNLAAIVAFMQCFHDVLGVVLTMAVAGNMACLCPGLTLRKRPEWVIGLARLGSRPSKAFSGRAQGKHQAHCLDKTVRELHGD